MLSAVLTLTEIISPLRPGFSCKIEHNPAKTSDGGEEKKTIGNGGIVNILTVAASPHINNPSDLVEILCLIIVYEKSNTLAPMTHCKVLPVQLLFHTFFSPGDLTRHWVLNVCLEPVAKFQCLA